jgi:hypothetical protein
VKEDDEGGCVGGKDDELRCLAVEGFGGSLSVLAGWLGQNVYAEKRDGSVDLPFMSRLPSRGWSFPSKLDPRNIINHCISLPPAPLSLQLAQLHRPRRARSLQQAI